MRTVENVAECTKLNVFEVEDLSVQIFINYVSYVTYKNQELEKQYKT